MPDWFEFDCPDCPATFEVDEPVRAVLLDVGCARCGTSVAPGAFSGLPAGTGADR
jgi:hypothetical protein